VSWTGRVAQIEVVVATDELPEGLAEVLAERSAGERSTLIRLLTGMKDPCEMTADGEQCVAPSWLFRPAGRRVADHVVQRALELREP
jgi:hypothetical protein